MGITLVGVDPRLIAYAKRNGLHITSTLGGKHNKNSKHPLGKAIDFRSRGLTDEFVEHLKRDAHDSDLILRDERVKPPKQKIWSAPHFHLECKD